MVTVRGYRIEDQDAVVTLWWNSWHSIRPGVRHPQPFAAWRTRWASEIAFKQKVVVADDEGTIVGFAAADVSARELAQIFVDPSRKGKGIGGQLLAWAKQLMPDGFSLHTLTDNLASRAFYERHGLIPGGTQINSVNGMETVEYRWVTVAR
jgi:GNAT superfamily N-acetyltransferase